MRYDMQCPKCGTTQEVQCRADDRNKQICGDVTAANNEVNGINSGSDAVRCEGVLEVLIAAVPTTKHPLGFTPGVIDKAGRITNAPKRKPSSMRRGK